jgi:hypothetical protein
MNPRGIGYQTKSITSHFPQWRIGIFQRNRGLNVARVVDDATVMYRVMVSYNL